MQNNNHDAEDINKPIRRDEVEKAIQKLRNNKATGPDQIPNEIMKYGAPEMINLLTEIFNTVFRTESIPEEWRQSEIVSIYKGKRDPEKMENKREITLASNIGKIFERVINNRLIENLPFTEGQAGGRKDRSTIDQFFILKSIIQNAFNQKKKLYIMFIDIEKAYDKTWQDGIMCILWKKGIKQKIWRVIKKLNEQLRAKCRTRVRRVENLKYRVAYIKEEY